MVSALMISPIPIHEKMLVKFLILIEPPKANKSKTLYMSPLDDIILDFMMEQDIPGASFALSKDGKLLYCQGEEQISQEIIFDIVIS